MNIKEHDDWMLLIDLEIQIKQKKFQLAHGVGENIILNLVSGETLVSPSILIEDDGFVKLIKSNTSVQTLIDYVNENF